MGDLTFTPAPELTELVEALVEGYDEIEPIGDGNDATSDDPGWWLTFIVKPADPDAQERNRAAVPTAAGWFELEQLVYWINGVLGAERAVRVRAFAKPPHLAGPGSLRFEFRGFSADNEAEKGIEPAEVAEFIRRIPAMIEADLEHEL